MAIEFNGKRNVGNVRIGNEVPKHKEVAKEEKVVEQQVDNKFVKELGEELLASAAVINVPVKKVAGEKIDHEFWGDALKGLNLKDTAISEETTKQIARMDETFAMIDMERKMANSPFMQALNKEFGI